MINRHGYRFFAFFIALGLCAAALTAAGQQAEPEARKITNFWRPGDPGERLYIDGRVLDENGKGIMGATVNIRQADGTGEYQPDRYRGSFTTDKDGGYAFGTVLPGQYYRAKHIHVLITHDNYAPLETRILFKRDPNLDEETARKHAIFLEEAQVKGEKVLFGRFDVVLKANAQ